MKSLLWTRRIAQGALRGRELQCIYPQREGGFQKRVIERVSLLKTFSKITFLQI